MIDAFSTWLTFAFFDVAPGSHLAEAIHFFFYDTIKILLLLIIMTHVMSLLRQFLPVEKMRTFLTSRHFFGLDYFMASLFGALTPFCSCSSIPLFIGFVQARIPLGLTFAFLTTSPLVNEVAFVIFLSAFGWKVSVIYAAAGIIIGMMSGMLLSRMHLENEVRSDLFEHKKNNGCACGCTSDTQSVLAKASREARGITKRVAPFILIGVGIGAAIHGFVPEGYFEGILETTGIFSVPLAVILAVPLYANASGVIPIIEALIAKGVEFGTALAFMMAVVGLSLPEAFILRRVMSLKLLVRFFGIVTIGIILIGYSFNVLF